jgi:hypothetical protein
MAITIVKVEHNPNPDNGAYDVTVTDGFITIKCSGILIWDPSMFNENDFGDWMELADAGEEGYEFIM